MSIPNIASYPMPNPADFPQSRARFTLDPDSVLLLIHDMQEYFLRPFERDSDPHVTLIQNVKALHSQCRRAGVPVVFSRQPSAQTRQERGLLADVWGPGVTARPHEADLVIQPQQGDQIVDKLRYSAFRRSKLGEIMAGLGRKQLIVCGIYAHIGCLMTAGDAFMEDLQVFLVGDACADFSHSHHRWSLDYIAGRCGMVLGVDDVAAALTPSGAPLDDDEVVEWLRHEVADFLELAPSHIAVDDNLVDLGFDSVRLMTMVDRVRQRGADVSFVDLAESPTLADWADLLREPQATEVAS